MVLYEDSRVNRMKESLLLWKGMTSSKFFAGTRFFLVLNQSDVMREKLKTTKIVDYFDDYEGRHYS